MADIKLTLSTDLTRRAPDIQAEKDWLEEEGRLWYPLGRNRPLNADVGCWVYFIREGKLVARAIAESIGRPQQFSKSTYTGETANDTGWEVEITEMELATNPIPHKGFRGFRYVQPSEQTEFESAFE